MTNRNHSAGVSQGAVPLFAPIVATVRRDLAIAVRRRADLLNPLIFFVVVVTLFPLAVAPDPQTLSKLGGGVVWIAALLASFLSLETLFRTDFDDGSIDQMLLSPVPLTLLVAAKLLVHWLVTGVPLILISPLLGLFLSLPDAGLVALVATLALGTPVLSLVGGIGTALTVGLKRGGALLALLVLPLYIPVLIFSAQAVSAAGTGLPITGQLYVLGAFLALALSLAPLAIAAALRVGAA